MKIVIVGPGAMGCLFGGFLSLSGQDVWFLDKTEERARLLEKTGIRIEGISGKHHASGIKATANPQEVGKSELVIICVKSYDTAVAIKQAVGVIEKDTVVLTLQNGLGNAEIISQQVGQERAMAGVTSEGATLLGVGHIRHAGRGPTVIGWVNKDIAVSEKDKIRQIVNILTKAGFKASAAANVEELIWSKLIINVGINALTAITRLNNGRLPEFEGTRFIMRQVIKEAVAVASSKGITLTYPDPIARVEKVCQATASNVASMLQDVLKKKKTEIEAINGAIVKEAQKLGLAVPFNEVLTNLVKTIESSYPFQVA